MGYKPNHRLLADFVSLFDQNLICSLKVKNLADTTKVFLQRSLAILKKNVNRHKETRGGITSLEVEVAKWRATTRTVWRVEFPMVENATVALAEVVRSNHRLLSKVNNIFTKLVSTRLEGDKVSRRYKDLLKEKNDLECEVKHSTKEKEALNAIVAESAKLIADL